MPCAARLSVETAPSFDRTLHEHAQGRSQPGSVDEPLLLCPEMRQQLRESCHREVGRRGTVHDRRDDSR